MFGKLASDVRAIRMTKLYVAKPMRATALWDCAPELTGNDDMTHFGSKVPHSPFLHI